MPEFVTNWMVTLGVKLRLWEALQWTLGNKANIRILLTGLLLGFESEFTEIVKAVKVVVDGV